MAESDEKLITLSNLEEFKNNLATVAISNDYDDLDNKPVMEYENTTNNTNRIKKDLSLRKTYTGVLGVVNGSATADKNTYANTSFYFLNVFPRSWYSEWTVKYHLNIHLDNETQVYKNSSGTTYQVGQTMRGLYDCMISGTQGAYSTFHFFQSQKNTSYRPIYYHMTHSPNSTGHDAGMPFKIGVSLASSYLPVPSTDYSSGSAVTTKYPRTIEVVVDEAINCDVSLNDTLEVEADAYVSSTNDMGNYTKLNSTYYTTNTSASNSAGRWNNLSATTQGLYESGDDNTYTYTQQSSNYLVNGTTYSDNSAGYLLGYSMIGFDKDGKALMISKKTPTTTTYATGIDKTRVYCNAGFDYTKGFRYISTSSNFAANSNMNVSTQINYSGLDFRYNDNCVAGSSANNLGLVNREPVYLRGTIGNDGLFYLAPIEVIRVEKVNNVDTNVTYKRAWVQPGDATRLATSPFDTEHVYWFVGYPYYNSSYPNSLYQLNLITQGELNKWNGTKLVPYTGVEGVTSVDWSDVQNKPTFANVATSGSYNDLTNKPTIPDAVIANPALAGTETDLTSLQVGNTKYKIPTMEDIGATIVDELLDDNVKLSEDLYVYTNVGLITGASSTSPKLVGEAGDTIKDVFNNMFVGQDENPTVTIPTLSISLATNGGQNNSLVKGEIIAPRYNISYGNVNGSYQYGSIETKTSTNTGVAVASSSFTIGGTAVTPSATISNSVTDATITSPTTIVVKSSGSSQTVGGTINLNLTNVKTARTKLGKTATSVRSGSTGSLDANGKLSNTTVTKSPATINVTSSSTLSVIKPSATITLSTTNAGDCEVGDSKTFTAKISSNNATGIYPNGYYVNNSGTRVTSTDAGCALTGLSLSKSVNSGAATSVSTSTADINTAKSISREIAEGTNTITISGNLTFSCDTTRCPASANHNMIDTTVGDYRINGSSSSYTASATSVSWTATGRYYNYYIASTAASAPTTGATKLSSYSPNNPSITINTTSGQYVYFYTKNSKTQIQQYVTALNAWNNTNTTQCGTVMLTLSNNKTATYYVCRTDALATATGVQLRLS